MFLNFTLIVFGIAVLLGLRWFLAPYFNYKRNKKDCRTEKILVHRAGRVVELPEYMKETKPDYLISFVVPAYNEEKRLPPMLEKTLDYMSSKDYKWEIIVVSDAAKDKTVKTALSFANYKGKNHDLKVIEYHVNKGKGGAVRIGMLASTGRYALFLDADGATEIKDFDKLFNIMKEIEQNELGIVAGSRNHIFNAAEVVRERKWYRNILGYVSNFIVNVICGVKMKDTQCGFKLFTRETVKLLFVPMHLERWAFDVELFLVANHYRIPVREVPVNWRDVEGSKLNVVEASTTMARDFVLIRVLYGLGIWRYTDRYTLPSSD